MAKSLMLKFNEFTDSRFSYLVLESVDVDVRSESVQINLIFPEPEEKTVRACEEEISAAIKKVMGLKSNVSVRLTKSHFDADFFKVAFLKFISAFPTVAPYVFLENMQIAQLEEYHFSVELTMDADICEYAEKRNVLDEIKKMLATNYCEKVDFKFVPVSPDNPISYIEEAEEELRNYVYQTNDGHFIIPQNVEAFIGNVIYERAGYISDAKREASGLVYCGTVSEFTECVRKKENEDEPDRKFYKFSITDPTGTLKCLYFPRKSKKKNDNAENNIVLLQDGKQIVVKGSLKANTFRGQTTYDMFVNSISLCTLPENLVIIENEFRTAKTYKVVSPQRYVEARQATLFDVAEPVAPYLLNKTFCVFDVETTGIDTTTNTIIELAAVKIVNGVITETLSTFVNPHEHISDRITQLTSITDEDVKDAPDICDVLADFYKFSENTILVGHNVGFDIGFVNACGKASRIYFSNQSEDTMQMARRYVKGLTNYKLKTVVKHFGIVNEHAHRAIHDTIATAKAFIKLAALVE